MPSELLIGRSDEKRIMQLGRMSNRHGLIAGATGTGKTVTLQVLAEGFSRLGIPVFAADIKGDLSGLAAAGQKTPKLEQRLQQLKLDQHSFQAFPVVLWDIYGETGHPVRTTLSEMGPLLLGSLLELNDNQVGLLYAAFKIADDEGMLLLDLKDLQALLRWMEENAATLRSKYGNISGASIGAIARNVLILEQQGGDHFFGEPALSLSDIMQVDFSGHGVISLLDATRLVQQSPRIYTAFLLWILAELFEQLPEQGDADRPKLVFFFDEAHLLFNNAPKTLLDKIEQVVRLIRSKGVGIYFISQSPTDIPDAVLGQLGLKIQHALRAFTPKDRKTIKTVAENFRANAAFDTESVLTELAIGEALVSVLDDKGTPTAVERTLIAPPQSRIGPIDVAERKIRRERSPFTGKYETMVDRESAYEILEKRTQQATQESIAEKPCDSTRHSGRTTQSVGEILMKSASRAIGSQIGRQLVRGILGSLLGGRRR